MSKNICGCNFNSKIAYIKTKNQLKKLHISNYSDEYRDKIICINEKKLCYNNPKDIQHHFKHVHYEESPMTLWHLKWQDKFQSAGQQIEHKIGHRRADVCIKQHKIVLEIQHSPINQNEINDRNSDYESHGYKVIWLIDGRDIEVSEWNGKFVIQITKSWHYKNFTDINDCIYLHKDQYVYQINPNDVTNKFTALAFRMKCESFIRKINRNGLPQYKIKNLSTIYFNQRGAGCGKTYESIQLLKSNKFKNKKWFIYLTKVHSAKDVIAKELNDQYKRGDLENIKIVSIKLDDTKQHKYSFKNEYTNVNGNIIIGTIDSFVYAIANKKSAGSGDYFNDLLINIKNNNTNIGNDGSTTYSKKHLYLNKDCIIIIDEAQDLGPEYIKSFDCIVSTTGIDVYVIGDILQSLYNKHNIFTYIMKEKNKPKSDIRVNIGSNIVKRFHNNKFIDFVNTIVPFEKYKIPKITGICEVDKCSFNHTDKTTPYHVIPSLKIYVGDTDEFKITKYVNNIMEAVNEKVVSHKYLPHNFMFIFPILYKNLLVSRLESELQLYWMKKFKENQYIEKVLKNNSWWKDKYTTDQKFVYLHKSVEGKPINIIESEHATRLLSIHASKGNGCEVVFVLGLTEFTLCKFCNVDRINKLGNDPYDRIVYESLLHVALTRHKKFIYVGINNDINDDIYKRFRPYLTTSTLSIPEMDKTITNKDLIRYRNNELYDICKYLLNSHEYLIPQDKKSNKENIDWGHHILRYTMFRFHILKNITNDLDAPDMTQFMTRLRKISKLEIKQLNKSQYFGTLYEISNSKYKIQSKTFDIPILQISDDRSRIYNKFPDMLVKTIMHVQQKIKNNEFDLCSFETAVLIHIQDVNDNGYYTDISIMEIYSLMYYMYQCYHYLDKKHECESCLCKIIFKNNQCIQTNDDVYSEIKKSICEHYNKISQIEKMYQGYIDHINHIKQKFHYNEDRNIMFRNCDGSINYHNKYDMIAYSDTDTLVIKIKPEFSLLNYNEIMLDCILDTYFLKNSGHYKNMEDRSFAYLDKPVTICIFTFDSEKPIFIKLDISHIERQIHDLINQYVSEKYQSYHTDLFKYYGALKKIENNPKINRLLSEIENYRKNTVPKYIIKWYKNIKQKIEDAEQDDIYEYINTLKMEKKFIKSITKSMDKSITNYFKPIQTKNYSKYDY